MYDTLPASLKPLLITGCNGQVGSSLCQLLPDQFIPCDRHLLDLSHPETLIETLTSFRPGCIINTASYNKVDQAEKEEALAHTINAAAVAKLAEYAFKADIPLIHFTTDYVFSGEGALAWREEAKASPINAYGRSKQAGEAAIASQAYTAMRQGKTPKWCILRTSWVYDAEHTNFLTKMLELAGSRQELTVVNDQIGSPTYAPDIADAVIRLLTKAQNKPEFPSGVYHLVSQGYISWHGFASAIIDAARDCDLPLQVERINPIPSADYLTPAKRPLNSRLSTDRLYDTFGIRLPRWENALRRCMEVKCQQAKEAA